jgi:hypothetical protein
VSEALDVGRATVAVQGALLGALFYVMETFVLTVNRRNTTPLTRDPWF